MHLSSFSCRESQVLLEIALTSCTQLKKYMLENGVLSYTIREDSEVFI
ncbi:hypothetical protein ANCCAN_27370 [Ancylostoma caninum]|uniref:Uncharacterized protein n=1 Tax=Ancylostoma caninum TaxID=29170 RepID=A0A368F458_ANCCA|nr:hypothetical protein ANCCAN_27370 [Ancylostoma caninum]